MITHLPRLPVHGAHGLPSACRGSSKLAWAPGPCAGTVMLVMGEGGAVVGGQFPSEYSILTTTSWARHPSRW